MVVIGGGPGGYRTAIAAARLGARVALVERGRPGGTCLNQGCIPKKSLLHLASLLEDVAALQGCGLAGEMRGDLLAALAHKDRVVAGIRDNFPLWLQRLGIRYLAGEARLAGRGRVAVHPPTALPSDAPQMLNASRIVLAPGSQALTLEGRGGAEGMMGTSQQFLEGLQRVPERVLCVGAGPIGIEFAYLFHQFGARVEVVEREPRILPYSTLPDRACRTLLGKFRRLGIEVRCGVEAQDFIAMPSEMEVLCSDGSRVRYDYILAGVGRRPATQGLGLAEMGVECDARGYILTDACLQTSVPGIYAVGDAKRSPMPAPMTANAALHDAKVAAANAVEDKAIRVNYLKVPFVVHSALEIAQVGLTEEQAEAAGFEPEVARATFAGCGKARACHDVEGYVEMVHDGETGQMLGGTIVGPEAGEQIHMLSAALQSTAGLWFFKDMSYSHPSWCEELENAVESPAAELARHANPLFKPGILASLA